MSSLLALSYTDNTQFGNFGYEERRWTAVVQAIRELQLAEDPEVDLSGLLEAANDLSDLNDAATARSNLGLGTMATESASDYLAVANNLSDVASAGTARSNLGLGTMATESASDYLLAINSLSDVGNAGLARNNLGLGSMATQSANDYLEVSNNLSDVASASTARGNLGLGTMATQDADSVNIDGGTVACSELDVTLFASSTTFKAGLGATDIDAGGHLNISAPSGGITVSSGDPLELNGPGDVEVDIDSGLMKIGLWHIDADVYSTSPSISMSSGGGLTSSIDILGDLEISASVSVTISAGDLDVITAAEGRGDIVIGNASSYASTLEVAIDADRIGFFGTSTATKVSISGARDDTEEALASLLSALDNLGLITDNTTAS